MNPDLIKGLFGDDKLGLYSSKLSGLFGDTSLDESFKEVFELLEKVSETNSEEGAILRSSKEDDEQISAIRDLKDNKDEIIILIEKLLKLDVPKEILIVLQEKLILMFGYETASNLNIPKHFNKEDLKTAIIEFFNFIDFENDEDIINNFRCNILKDFIKEFKICLSEI